MATPVIMPRQGQSVESCIITQWMKNKGDKVAVGDLLFSYETDKAAFDEESTVAGTLLEVFFEDGDEVPVLTNVCVIGSEGEDQESFRPGGESVPEEISLEEKVEEVVAQEIYQVESDMLENEKVRISPRARKKAVEYGVHMENLSGTGPKGRIIERDIIAATASQPAITPLARKKMEMDHGSYFFI